MTGVGTETSLMTKSQPSLPLVADSGPRIYLACLAAYNSGRLHGMWVRADQGEEHIWNALRAMIAGSPVSGAEEWAIHDYAGFEGAGISESASFGLVCELAEFISEHGELGARVYEHFGNNLRDARTAFEQYAGEFKTAAVFAEQVYDEVGTQIPANLQHYVDWSSLARDMELNGDIIIFELGFETAHIFWAG